MRTVAVTSPNTLSIVEVPRPEAGPYDVLVKNEVAFICNATDRKVVEGHFPGMGPENYPLILGHESAGTVVETGSKVRSFRVGDRAIGGLVLSPGGGVYKSGWGGHSEYVLIKDHAAMVADGVADAAHGWNEVYKIMRPVPPDIGWEAAGLLCTWREVYSGFFSDFRLGPDSEIAVFGAGPVGLSFVRFARLKGFRYVASVDPLANKRDKALAMGAHDVFATDDPAVADLPRRRGRPLDAVIDAVGHESIINAGIPLVRMGGSVCVYGVVGAPRITLEKDRGPYNFNLLVHQWPTRDAEAAAQEPLIEWIRSGKLRAADFVTSVFPVDEIARATEETARPTNIKTMLTYDKWK